MPQNLVSIKTRLVQMSKTIICSVGISAGRLPNVRPAELLSWVKQQPSREEAARLIFENFYNIKPEGTALSNVLSAEIHSLVRIDIRAEDRVILLASETDDCYCCALAIRKYLEQYWPGIIVKVEKISGLQIEDVDKFRQQGVVNFVKRILTIIQDYNAENIVLNTTAGFKALVPYATLIGMLKGVECQYIFERSTTLLTLPPLPIEFSRSKFEVYRKLFEQIEREGAVAEAELESLGFVERSQLDPLLERVGGEVTLSAVGLLVWEELNPEARHSACVPFLSRQAMSDCFDNLAQLKNRDPIQFLNRMAQSEQLREEHVHYRINGGLRWLKPGGHTVDRYLISIEGWKMLVWRVIREDQEGKDYSQKVKVDVVGDRDRYAPFFRMEYV